jgi:L-asparaginase II
MSPTDREHALTHALHFGFRAPDREAVGGLWRAGIDTGYSDAGAPDPAHAG